ncbi:MAG TPA: hypothetical protein VM425_10930 [Myxococcota bacterium]|nr:hypothetical protein [Myxococcota bacterium]
MKSSAFLSCACLMLLTAACGGLPDDNPDAGHYDDADLHPPDFWDPGEKPSGNCSYGYGEDCPEPAIDCDEDPCIHGDCIAASAGSDHCLCDQGYAGLLCDRCARGYTEDGLICVPGDPCSQSPCLYGTCRPQDGGFFCDCQTGYAGELCDRCADGYHVEGLKCVLD